MVFGLDYSVLVVREIIVVGCRMCWQKSTLANRESDTRRV